MKSLFKCVLFVWIFSAVGALATVYWVPEKPTKRDKIKVFIATTNGVGEMHWGVNATGKGWEEIIPEYLPSSSYMTGKAVRTPLTELTVPGIYTAEIGPFDDTNQLVRTIDFVFVWSNTIWESNQGKDYQIDVSQGRITVSPKEPTANDPIIVTIHESGDEPAELRWGVNQHMGAWEQPREIYRPKNTIPSDDGSAVDTLVSVPDKNGQSTVILGPFNQGEQVVTSLHMAAHWGKDWDTDFSRNYNVDIRLYPSNEMPILEFERPAEGQSFDEPFLSELSSSTNGLVSVWLDGELVVADMPAPYELPIEVIDLEYGQHTLSAETKLEDGSKALAAISFWYVPQFKQAFRSSKMPFGAIAEGDGKVTFALYAPEKKYVSLIGTMNDWVTNATMMDYSPNGIWWKTLDLTNGVYEYQYVLDGHRKVADPYSTDVNWTDETGEETWRTEDARSVVEVGAAPFEWSDADFSRPLLNELIIYEVFINDFCPGEGFKGITKRLDYLESLGINAIEPLPWNEFSGSSSWGYNPAFHFAPEGYYGTPEDLKELVNEAHKRGIAVIMDTVLNHLDGRAPLFEMYGADYDASPYFYHFTGENWGFPDLDQNNPAVKRYVADVMKYWITDYHIDGFRYDATRWVGWEGYNDWGASWFAYAAKMVDPNVYTIAEHIPTDPDLVNLTEMDTGWDAFFHWRMKDMLKNREVYSNDVARLLQPVELGYEKDYQRIPYVESHDEERMMYEFEEAGMADDEATRRAILGNVLTLTAPGVPMLFAGQEWGENTKKQVGENFLHWDYMEEAKGKAIYDATVALIHQRKTNPALISGWTDVVENDEERDSVVYVRTHGDHAVLVGINFGAEPVMVDFPLSFAGSWTELLTGRTLNVRRAVTISQKLQPGGCVVLVGQKTAVAE